MVCNMLKISNTLFRQRIQRGLLYYSDQTKDKKNNTNPEDVSTESLQWRTPWGQQDGEWYSKLKAFGSEHNNTDVIRFLQTPVDFSPSTIKRWWKRKQLEKEIYMQQYIPERNQILGDELAAAHFIVHRGGSVKFVGENVWIKQNENLEYVLPNVYVPNKFVHSIDCSNMQLHYEGLENLRGLKKLERLNLSNCQYMDDWCIDRVSAMFQDTLLYLDVRNCKNVSYRGIGALYKLKNLQFLCVDDIKSSKSLELTCLMLQELSPKLQIKM